MPVKALAGRLIVGALVALASACSSPKDATPTPPSKTAATVNGPAALDSSSLLAHKIDCMKQGVQAEKVRLPDGQNGVEALNHGEFNFDPEYAYSEHLNTCLVLDGFETIDLKTGTSRVFQATITDLLGNKVLFHYFALNGRLISPPGIQRDAFIAKVRESFGEPIPKWLEIGPHVPAKP